MANNTSKTPIIDATVEPKPIGDQPGGKKGDAAFVKGTVMKEWLGVVHAEERSHLFRGLIKDGLGTREVEHFILKQSGLRSIGGRVKVFFLKSGKLWLI